MGEILIEKIISGGQTGVDFGALIAARQMGIPTGGWAPRTFRTELGSNPLLGSVYGLAEHKEYIYPPRTKQNVLDADATVLIQVKGVHSPGSMLTWDFCEAAGKDAYRVIIADLHDPKPYVRLVTWLEQINPKIVNFAGHRESSVPGIQEWTRLFLCGLFDNEG